MGDSILKSANSQASSKLFSKIAFARASFHNLALALTLALASSVAVADSAYPELANVIGQGAYVPVYLQRLKSPKFVYLLEGESPKKMMSEAGVVGKLPSEPESAFLPEIQTWYAEGYGGMGLNNNFGSGRTASKGRLQLKGSGPTAHVNPNTDAWHSSGTLVLHEAIKEAYAAEIANYEMPYGANRVLAIISTGTHVFQKHDGKEVPRVYLVRQDPLRPAHFMRNPTAMKEPAGSPYALRESLRMSSALDHLIESLPQKRGFRGRTNFERLRSGLIEFMERKAETLAYGYSRSRGHLASSPSNTEIDGKLIDFPSFFAFDGYPRAWALMDDGPLGDTRPVLEDIILDFFTDLRETLPANLKAAVPSVEETKERFFKFYHERLNRHFVDLTGLPTGWLSAKDNHAIFSRLGGVLLRIAQDGNTEFIDLNINPPGKTGTYDLGAILRKLAGTTEANSGSLSPSLGLDAAIRPMLANDQLRSELVGSYMQLLGALKGEAERREIPFPNVVRYLTLASEIRNRKVSELFPGAGFDERYGKLMKEFTETGDGSRIGEQIKRDIESARRTFRDAPADVLVLKQFRDESGNLKRAIFDVRTGKTSEIVVETAKAPTQLRGGVCRAALAS